jgi:hypothetical protein
MRPRAGYTPLTLAFLNNMEVTRELRMRLTRETSTANVAPEHKGPTGWLCCPADIEASVELSDVPVGGTPVCALGSGLNTARRQSETVPVVAPASISKEDSIRIEDAKNTVEYLLQLGERPCPPSSSASAR